MSSMASRAEPPAQCGAEEGGRRIVALVMPLLAPEIARFALGGEAMSGGHPAPLAVLIDELAVARAARQLGLDFGAPNEAAPIPSSARDDDGARAIDAVDEVAHALGVRPGQRVSEASALTHGLVVAHVASRAIEEALARIADVALGMGPTVSIGPPDTVWVDVTGAAHLRGGEERLLADLEVRVRALGHRVRAALADGPRIARALARHGRLGRERVVPPGRSAEALASLPVRSLFQPPLRVKATSTRFTEARRDPMKKGAKKRSSSGDETEIVQLLARLGVWTVEDLARLPAAATAARLGPSGQEILALAAGRDPMPLAPHRPPAMVIERTSLDDGIENAGALVFVARGLVSRAAGRLGARSEAASRLEIELAYDASIFALREGVAGDGASSVSAGETAKRVVSPSLVVAVDLPAPLSHETDLLRAVKAKIEALTLAAPVVAMRIVLSRIGKAPEVQLGMDRDRSLDPDALPALLSELAAELGEDRLGVLAISHDHRPEAQSRLEPPRLGATADDVDTLGRVSLRHRQIEARRERELREAYGERASDFDARLLESPTRLLRATFPISIGPSELGATDAPPRTGKIEAGMSLFASGRRLLVEEACFERRVDGARWWTSAPTSRDYSRVWITGRVDGGAITAEAWIYVDRRERTAEIHGFWE